MDAVDTHRPTWTDTRKKKKNILGSRQCWFRVFILVLSSLEIDDEGGRIPHRFRLRCLGGFLGWQSLVCVGDGRTIGPAHTGHRLRGVRCELTHGEERHQKASRKSQLNPGPGGWRIPM